MKLIRGPDMAMFGIIVRTYTFGECKILMGREPKYRPDELLLHISISCEKR